MQSDFPDASNGMPDRRANCPVTTAEFLKNRDRQPGRRFAGHLRGSTPKAAFSGVGLATERHTFA